MADQKQPDKRTRPDPTVTGERAFDAIPSLMLLEGLLVSRGGGATTIGLTAMKGGSGVTSVVAGLAAALGREANQRVVVVDASATGRRLVDLLSLQQSAVPLDQFESLAPVDTGALPAVHAGPAGYDVAVLAGAPGLTLQAGFKAWWGQLQQRYTIVLVDLGALETGAPMRWGRLVEQFVLVLDASRDTFEMAAALRENQEFSKLPFKGFIINKREYHVPNFFYRLLS